jgi:hypothetical protein
MYTYTEWCQNRKSKCIAKAIRKFRDKYTRRGIGHRKVAIGVQMKRMHKGRSAFTGKSTLGFRREV